MCVIKTLILFDTLFKYIVEVLYKIKPIGVFLCIFAFLHLGRISLNGNVYLLITTCLTMIIVLCQSDFNCNI